MSPTRPPPVYLRMATTTYEQHPLFYIQAWQKDDESTIWNRQNRIEPDRSRWSATSLAWKLSAQGLESVTATSQLSRRGKHRREQLHPIFGAIHWGSFCLCWHQNVGPGCGEEGCLAVLEVKKIMQQMFLILLPKRPILASRHFAGRDPATEKVCRSGRGSQTSRGNTYDEVGCSIKQAQHFFAHLRQDCLPLSRYKKTTAARILPLQPHVLGLKDSRPMRIPFWGILTSGYFSTNELKCWKVLQLAHRWKLDTSKMVQCPTVVDAFTFGWSYWDLGTLELRSSELLFLGFFFQNPWMRCLIRCECSWVCLSQISL